MLTLLTFERNASRSNMCVLYLLLVLSAYVNAKVFDRCELAQLLHHKHHLDLREVAIWTCIAQHSSNFNTAAYAGSTSASGSHGLFQINDKYWCSPPGKGYGCNLPCSRLRDNDLTDDLNCVHIIYDEHQRISGNGWNAWNAYQQHCQQDVEKYVYDCFSNKHTYAAVKQGITYTPTVNANAKTPFYANSLDSSFGGGHKISKIYERCELAQELFYKHKMPMEQIPTWVCIAKHESNFDTSAVGRLNADGSADHGLFQVSDLYWCSHDRYSGGKACGMQCTKLLDNDITDDVRCIKRIYGEHKSISGDGFTAWTVYDENCRNLQYAHVASCFKDQSTKYSNSLPHHTSPSHAYYANPYLKYVSVPTSKSTHRTQKNQYTFQHTHTTQQQQHTYTGKIYKRCELAQELYFKHKFPMQDIATWVCIAQYESNYNTSAVGRFSGSGSADHGLFQISDLYWCTHDQLGGKACNVSCAKLLDADISDDVRCIRTIYEEHTRLSGDGFKAWTVYEGRCRNQGIEQIENCFNSNDTSKTQQQPFISTQVFNNEILTTTTATEGLALAQAKIYEECELAQELHYKHHLPLKDIPTYVCIAKHESNFNTSAVGRRNFDGSADHGLFQISDLYWCAQERYGGKACNIPCEKLLDANISDDVQCVKTIYAEHKRLSGDGFTAWDVYNQYCRDQQLQRVADCFPANELEQAQNEATANGTNTKEIVQKANNSITTTTTDAPQKKTMIQQVPYHNNPFLQKLPTFSQNIVTKTSIQKQKPESQTTLNSTSKNKSNIGTTRPYVNSEMFRTTPVKTDQKISIATTTSVAAPQNAVHQHNINKESSSETIFSNNPFISKLTQAHLFNDGLSKKPKTHTNSESPKSYSASTKTQNNQEINYSSNPFLNKFNIQSSNSAPIESANKKTTTTIALLQKNTQPHTFEQIQYNHFLHNFSASALTMVSTLDTKIQQQTSTTPISTSKTKSYIIPNKSYVNSELFRTTPVKGLATLEEENKLPESQKLSESDIPTKKETTITTSPVRQITKQYFSAFVPINTTKKPTTMATVIRKPSYEETHRSTTTSKRPSTTPIWRWEQSSKTAAIQNFTEKPKAQTVTEKNRVNVSTTKTPKSTLLSTKPKNTQNTFTAFGSTTNRQPFGSTTPFTRNTTRWPLTKSTTKNILNTKATASTTTTRKPTASVNKTTSKPMATFQKSTITTQPSRTTPATGATRPISQKSHTTTKSPTTAAVSFNYYFTTTKVPYKTTKQLITEPFNQFRKKLRISTTTKQPSSKTITTTPRTTTEKQPISYLTSKQTKSYRDDPFSHPFFAKFNEKFNTITSTTTTPKSTTSTDKYSSDGESKYYQQFRNHTADNAKTLYAFSFGQKATQTGRNYGR